MVPSRPSLSQAALRRVQLPTPVDSQTFGGLLAGIASERAEARVAAKRGPGMVGMQVGPFRRQHIAKENDLLHGRATPE
jgi:hypothetical protein